MQSLKHLALSIILIFALPHAAFASFLDVGQNHEYIEGITYLELQGAVDSNMNFKPDENINRAALFKILFKIFGENEDEVARAISFNDVPENSWFTPFAQLADKYELIKTPNGNFYPEKPVRRAEALNILLKAYGAGSPIVPKDGRANLFSDVSKNHPFYSIVKRVVDLGLLSANTSEKFTPYSPITRGEFADLIYKFDNWQTMNFAGNNSIDFYKSDIFANIWETILSGFYLEDDQYIDKEALFSAAIKGMIQSLGDPYTAYLSGEEADGLLSQLSGEYEGIGAYILEDEVTNQFFITEFTEGSPAKEIGLKIGDEILEVDGVSTSNMAYMDLIRRIRGEEGTDVRLKIQREGVTHYYNITRTALTVSSASAEIIQKDVWLIDVDTFANDTDSTVFGLIEDLREELPDPSAIVIDLRGNTGGYVSAANSVAGLFAPHLTPLVHLDYGYTQDTIYNGDVGPYQDYPVYIFVDHYSASASEILAGTLQEVADATVIGTQTYGKGSVQQMIQYWDGSLFKITIAHWLTSEGNSINGVGITPDILITDAEITAAGEDYKNLWLEELKKKL